MAEVVYVGIDVSKAELVVAVRPSAECVTLANNPAGIRRLVAKLRELEAQLVVVEGTGGLQRQVVAALWAAEIAVAVVNPAWVRNFAKGRGLQAKTDRKDAELLALYAERERPTPRPRPIRRRSRCKRWSPGASSCWRCWWPKNTDSSAPFRNCARKFATTSAISRAASKISMTRSIKPCAVRRRGGARPRSCAVYPGLARC